MQNSAMQFLSSQLLFAHFYTNTGGVLVVTSQQTWLQTPEMTFQSIHDVLH